MAEKLVGCFVHKESENMEEYLEALEIPESMRKMMLEMNPTVELSNDGDTWTISYKMAAQTMIVSLEIGKETDDFMFGQMSKKVATITEEDNHLQVRDENAKGVLVNTFSPMDCGGLKIEMVIEGKDITATRCFERVNE